jgi:hypothetical protein
MVAKEIRRDPEQPRSGVRVCGVEAITDMERLSERLRSKVVGEVGADATNKVSMDRVEMAVEDGRERMRLRPRSGDDLRVRPCLH